MSTVFAELISSSIEDGATVMEVRVPALSATVAKQRARAFVRGKGIESSGVRDVNKIGSGTLPGQTVYKVSVEGKR